VVKLRLKFLDPNPGPDYRRDLIVSSLARVPPFHRICENRLSVVFAKSGWKTNKQTEVNENATNLVKVKAKVKVRTLDNSWNSTSEAFRYSICSQVISQFYLHTHTFIRNQNQPYLPLPSEVQLVLIYRPRRDGRLSWPGGNNWEWKCK